MNWYKKIAAPLPESDNFNENLYDDKYKGVHTNKGYKNKTPSGIEGIDDILEEYKDNRIIDYIGAGNEGIAYQLDNGHVLKITSDMDEYEVAQQLLGNPKKHIVNVFAANIIQDDFESVFGLEIEKVIPIDSQEGELFEHMLGSITQGRKNDYDASLQPMYKNIKSLVLELTSSGYGFNDVHWHNVGKRGNDYVVLDLGGLLD